MAGMKPISQVTAIAAQATSWPVFLRGFCQISLRDAEGCVFRCDFEPPRRRGSKRGHIPGLTRSLVSFEPGECRLPAASARALTCFFAATE